MKKKFAVVTLLGMMALGSGCKKVYDYIEQHPTGTCDACKIVQVKVTPAGSGIQAMVYDVSYDKKGNMISMLTKDRYDGSMYDLYFRYDKQNKLTDYIVTRVGSNNVEEWRYYYYYPGKIIDTFYLNVTNSEALATDPTPPYHVQLAHKLVEEQTLDSKGRVTNVKTYNAASPLQYTTNWNYVYNASENLTFNPTPIYDNKINPYRTNPTWQLVQRDFSVNNAFYNLDDPRPSLPLPSIVSYNEYGLPTKYVINDSYGNRPMFGMPFYNSIEITYNCDLSNVKVK
jgi:hypothetical protein